MIQSNKFVNANLGLWQFLSFAMFLLLQPISSMALSGVDLSISAESNVGEISALAVDPKNPSTLYVRAKYGVVKSTDGGQSWFSVSKGIMGKPDYPRLLAIDPNNPAVLYATFFCCGLVKTTDAGLNWQQINTGLPGYWPSGPGPELDFIVIDKNNSEIIYVRYGGNSYYKTTNGGMNWSKLNQYGYYPRGQLAIDPHNPSTFYEVYAGDGTTLIRSLDGGQTWTPINVNLSYSNLRDIVIDPNNSSVLYLSSKQGIIKSTDGGLNWHIANIGLPFLNEIDNIGLSIDPTNSSILYLSIYNYVGNNGNLYKSINGGESWFTISSNPAFSNIGQLTFDPFNSSILYVVTTRWPFTTTGVFKSTDGGANWTAINVVIPMKVRPTYTETATYDVVINQGAIWDYGKIYQGLNDIGQLVGSDINSHHAILWNANVGITNLGTLGGLSSIGMSINNNNQVAGDSQIADGNTHAFYWSSDTGMVDLGTLGGTSSHAAAINATGIIVGYSDTSTGQSHAFLWSSVTGMRDLGTLGGATSKAVHINSGGQIVGVSDTSNGRNHGFIWNAETGLTDLGTLGGQSSDAAYINQKGEVFGLSDIPQGQSHVFKWTRSNGLIDLGDLDGQSMGRFNENGQILGGYSGYGGSGVSIWHHGISTDIYRNANIINNLGQIAGSDGPLFVDTGNGRGYFVVHTFLASPSGILNWIGGTTGNWDEPNNWEMGFVPNKFLDTVIAPQAGNTLVAGPAIDATVNSLSLGGGGGNAVLSLNSGVLMANHGVTLLSGGILSLEGNNKLVSSSTLTLDGGVLDIKSNNVSLAEVQLKSGSITTTTGILTSTNHFDFQSGTVSANLGGSVGLNKTTSGTVVLSGNHTYTGTTKVTEGTLAASGAINGAVSNDANIKGNGQGVTLAGDVLGSGNYTGNVTFAKSFSPGHYLALVTAENVSFAPTNTLIMELGGLTRATQYDAINASNLKLGGRLDIRVVNGYVPLPGDSFQLINAQSISGNFDVPIVCPQQINVSCKLFIENNNLVLTFFTVSNSWSLATECLLNWAENAYPDLLAPAGSPTAVWNTYTYRHYSASDSYVGASTVNNHVYYMGQDGNLQDVGSLSDWLPKAGCQVPPPPPPATECLFNWAERTYSDLFAPSGTSTATADDDFYRYYSITNSYLRLSSVDNHVIYQGSDGVFQDVGLITNWLPLSSCQ